MTGYWFADVDPDYQDDEYRWQPCLQLDGSICHSFEVWFESEAKCRQYIAENIIGAPLEDE